MKREDHGSFKRNEALYFQPLTKRRQEAARLYRDKTRSPPTEGHRVRVLSHK